MYLRIIWGRVREGQWGEFEKAYKQAIELTRKWPGLKGRWLARDSDDADAGYSITLWETETAMHDYMSSPIFREKIGPMVQPFFVNQYTVTHCEVRASDELSS